MSLLRPQSEIAVVDPAQALIRGYAAVTGNVIEYFDPHTLSLRRLVFRSGAFAAALDKLGGQPIPIYWSHESYRLQLGETTILREDDVGLYFEGTPFATRDAIDQLTVMDGRRSTGASMGFLMDERAITEENGIEYIETIESLIEVGPTPVGVNPLAWSEVVSRDEQAAAKPVAAVASAVLAAGFYAAAMEMRRSKWARTHETGIS